ncbi:MAG TPA: hypothetical protein VML75_07200, partial [Kofleriaceae bacterium]|nr:hypothetical protein [Kofleriaceae bacterium]
MAHLAALALGLSGCGGDPPLTTARFRLLGPPPIATDGTCPTVDTAGPMSLPTAELLRLTY